MERQFGGGVMLIIDAGHGGKDPGAVSAQTYEKTITLKVAKTLEAYLKEKGVPCLMTRTNDTHVTLQKRVQLSNESKGTHFISLHVNAAADASASGLEIFVDTKGGEKERLAMAMQSDLVKVTGFKDRGVKFSPFYVLRNTKQTALLIELGFITNASEREEMISDAFVKKVAHTIGNTYLKHIGFQEPAKQQWETLIEGMDPKWHDEILSIISEGGLRRYLGVLIEKVYDTAKKS